MPANDSPPVTALQFDTAEYLTPQAVASACCACKQPIAQAYYTINAEVVCEQCRHAYGAFRDGGSKVMRTLTATTLGLLAGLAGAAIWYAVRMTTGYEIGLIAIVVGVMVGHAVRKGARGRGGLFYQTLAIALTYACISAQYMPDIIAAFAKQARESESTPAEFTNDLQAGEPNDNILVKDASAEKPTSIDAAAQPTGLIAVTFLFAVFFLVAFVMALTVPVLSGLESPIGLLIVGFALYEAWKINRQPSVQIAGPFQLAPPAVSGALGA